jgi:hypothetical protein
MAAAREEMAATAWRRQEQEDHAGAEAAMAMARKRDGIQYPLPSYEPWQQCEDDMRTFTSLLEDVSRITFGSPISMASLKSISRCFCLHCKGICRIIIPQGLTPEPVRNASRIGQSTNPASHPESAVAGRRFCMYRESLARLRVVQPADVEAWPCAAPTRCTEKVLFLVYNGNVVCPFQSHIHIIIICFCFTPGE